MDEFKHGALDKNTEYLDFFDEGRANYDTWIYFLSQQTYDSTVYLNYLNPGDKKALRTQLFNTAMGRSFVTSDGCLFNTRSVVKP